MTTVQLFWHFLAYVNSLTVSCRVLTESTHSQVDTQHPVLYGGNCAEAFRIVLYAPGQALAWIIGA